jgi:hypothetical protein
MQVSYIVNEPIINSTGKVLIQANIMNGPTEVIQNSNMKKDQTI